MIGIDALALHIRYTWLGQRVGDRLLDPEAQEVRLASTQGWYWTLLGLGMGWVRPELAPLLRTSPPLLSDVQPRLMGEFIVPDEALGEDGARTVWHRYPGGCLVDLERAWSPRVMRRGREVAWAELVQAGGAREHGERVWIDLGPEMELVFVAGGVTFSSRLVGTAQAIEPVEADAHDVVWLVLLTLLGGAAVVLALCATWDVGLPGHSSLSVEQVRGAIIGR